MDIQITIAGTDRTGLVRPESLIIRQVLTNQVDTCKFIIKKFGSRTFTPTVGQEVIITNEDDSTKLFAGRVTVVEELYEEVDMVGYEVRCVDYTRDLQQKLVIEEYTDTTIDDIIADLQSSGYIPDTFTTTNVDAPVTIKYVQFNYEAVDQVLKQLADAVNYDWYVDYDKDIHFFAKSTEVAPFELSDTNGNYIYDSLIIRKDITPVRNSIIVRGGRFFDNTVTVERTGDGIHQIWGSEEKFRNVAVTVTGQAKDVGIDFIDDPTNHDALYNFQQKFVRFRGDKIPRSGSLIKISGEPQRPVIVKVRDPASVALFSATEGNSGIHEFLVVDKSIESKEGARQRGRAELLKYAATLEEGRFETYTDGLRAGQQIRVQSDERGLDKRYVITRVEARMHANQKGTGQKLTYLVQFVTTKTFDYIDLLQKLLLDSKKEIEFEENEVLDQVENADEIIEIAESVTTTSVEPPFKWGPTGVPEAKWGLAEWD